MSERVYDRIVVDAKDTDEPLIGIYYTGPYHFATVAVAAGGDITCCADDTDGTTTTALAGVAIDVSNASYDTWGEVIDFINGYVGWYAFPIGARRSDSSNDTAITLTAADCKQEVLNLHHDTSIALDSDSNYAITIGVSDEGIGADNTGKQILIGRFSVKVGYGSGTPAIKVYDCDVLNKSDSEIYSIAAAASGSTQVEGLDTWHYIPLTGGLGHRLILRVINTVAFSEGAGAIDCWVDWGVEHIQTGYPAGTSISHV